MRQQLHDSCEWAITEVRDEAHRVRSFLLKAVGERPTFISGQYLTVRLPNFEPAEGKSYSISSSEKDELVRLTIKEMGPFSKVLYGARVNDVLTTSLPYGFFYPEKTEERELIFITGGIGVTPCMSIIETYCREKYPKNISLFYSNKTVADTIFKKDLDALQNEFEHFSVSYHITREKADAAQFVNGRVSGKAISTAVRNPHDSDYFICGSIDFTKNLWKELRECGVLSSQLYTEGFY